MGIFLLRDCYDIEEFKRFARVIGRSGVMGTEESFGRFIAIRRRHLQLTQADLANKMGVSKSAIAKWETGGGLPDRNNLRKLSEAINLSVDDLHRAIEHEETKEPVLQVNITPEVIAMLESYGYKVIGPNKKKGETG